MNLGLEGKSAIVTSGATIERIDSVRFLSNFSSGKQGAAIALALANAGAQVTLISGKSTKVWITVPLLRGGRHAGMTCS